MRYKLLGKSGLRVSELCLGKNIREIIKLVSVKTNFLGGDNFLQLRDETSEIRQCAVA